MGTSTSLKIRWSAAAVRHLEEATDYIAQDKRTAAASVRRRLLKTVALLASSPFAGRTGRIEGTREAVVPKSSLILVYQIAEDRLEVLGLWHTSREWPKSVWGFTRKNESEERYVRPSRK